MLSIFTITCGTPQLGVPPGTPSIVKQSSVLLDCKFDIISAKNVEMANLCLKPQSGLYCQPASLASSFKLEYEHRLCPEDGNVILAESSGNPVSHPILKRICETDRRKMLPRSQNSVDRHRGKTQFEIFCFFCILAKEAAASLPVG